MHVLADYGEIQFMTPAPTVERSEGEAVYRTARVVLRVREQPCQDIMSGEEFPAIAVLELDGRVLEGCGQALN